MGQQHSHEHGGDKMDIDVDEEQYESEQEGEVDRQMASVPLQLSFAAGDVKTTQEREVEELNMTSEALEMEDKIKAPTYVSKLKGLPKTPRNGEEFDPRPPVVRTNYPLKEVEKAVARVDQLCKKKGGLIGTQGVVDVFEEVFPHTKGHPHAQGRPLLDSRYVSQSVGDQLRIGDGIGKIVVIGMAPTADLLPPWLCEGDTSPSGVPVASLAEALKRVYNMDMVAMDVIPFVPSYSWHIRTVKERGGWTEPHNKGDKKLLSLLVQVLAEQDPSIKGFLLLGSTSRLVLIDKDAKTGEYSPSVSNLNDKPAATAFHPILVYNAVNSPQETFNMLYLARSTLRLVQGGKLKDFWPVLREVYERRSGGGFLMEANDIETVLGFKLSAAKCSNIPASIASAAKINRDSPAYEANMKRIYGEGYKEIRRLSRSERGNEALVEKYGTSTLTEVAFRKYGPDAWKAICVRSRETTLLRHGRTAAAISHDKRPAEWKDFAIKTVEPVAYLMHDSPACGKITALYHVIWHECKGTRGHPTGAYVPLPASCPALQNEGQHNQTTCHLPLNSNTTIFLGGLVKEDQVLSYTTVYCMKKNESLRPVEEWAADFCGGVGSERVCGEGEEVAPGTMVEV